jgi:hypothetical protein
MAKSLHVRRLVALSVLALACSGDGGGGGTAPPTPTSVQKTGGDDQTGIPGVTLPQPLEVTVRDQAGGAVAGHPVTFAATAGTSNPPSTTTDTQGRARSLLTLPSQSGTVSVTATAQGLPPVIFTAQAVPPPVQITTEFLPAARAGLPYSRPLAAAGGTSGGGYTFSVASGSLPSGLRLDGSTITGTPDASGAFPVTLRASDGAGGEASRAFTIHVCDVPAAMAVGEVRAFEVSSRGSCGLFVPSGEAGARYRVAVVRTESHENGGDVAPVSFVVHGNGVGGGVVTAAARTASARSWLPVPGFDDLKRRLDAAREIHLRDLAASEALVRSLGARDVLRPRPTSAVPAAAALADKLRLDASTPSTCGPSTPTTPVTAIRLAENEWLALYQDSAQNAAVSTRVTGEEAERVLQMATTYGKRVIDEYFGGVADIDGNGKVIVFVTPAVGGSFGRVWSGDFYPKANCAASNAGEVVYLNYQAVRGAVTANIHPGFMTLVHELKHVASLYQRLLRAGGGAVDATRQVEFHPIWMEEGSADMAAERAARFAWSELGGLAMNTMLDEARIRGATPPYNQASTETLSVLVVLDGTQNALFHQPNSLVSRTAGAPEASVYATGWVFQRWLADAYGGAAAAPFGDAPFFRALNDRTSASGVAGIEARTGRSWAQLVEEFSVAAMANGRGMQVERGFTSYDFVSATEMWCFAVDPIDHAASGCQSSPGAPGAFPWPVTTDSQGRSESVGFGDRILQGGAGPSGIRVYDLLSNGTGAGTEINVEIGAPVRIRVLRLR